MGEDTVMSLKVRYGSQSASCRELSASACTDAANCGTISGLVVYDGSVRSVLMKPYTQTFISRHDNLAPSYIICAWLYVTLYYRALIGIAGHVMTYADVLSASLLFEDNTSLGWLVSPDTTEIMFHSISLG